MAGSANLKPFQKGQSGNPSGRPKSDEHIKALARVHTEDALNALVAIATKGQSESAKVSAAVALLDRGWGRPAQPVSGSIDVRHYSEMTDAELAAIVASGQPDATGRSRRAPETTRH